MLILTRTLERPTICIQDNISITVLEISRGQVRLGIDAPQDIEVHREEIFERIQKEELV